MVQLVKLLLFPFILTSLCLAQSKSASNVPLSAAEIAVRNAAARGGLKEWRAVQTMVMSGMLEAGGNSRTTLQMPGRKDNHFMPAPRPVEQVKLPFEMSLRRPNKMRVEVRFNGQTAVQVYDGVSGWKLRPFLNRKDIEAYTEDELKSVGTQAELDGPLLDYAAKGTTIVLDGTEKVEGRDTFRLTLKLKNGRTTDVWIDAKTFLDAKIQGAPRRLDSKLRPVEIYFRDYRAVNGLQVPFVLETRVLNMIPNGPGQAVASSEQILLEKVMINPSLPEARFTRADLLAASTGQSSPLAVSERLQ